MVRYFFHIRDGGTLIPDDEGTELLDIESARREARASARDLLIDDLRCKTDGESRTLEIADKNGSIIEVFNVRDALH
jgi:hypothetical protein